MKLDELEQRYGLYVAEMVRQAVTLEEFNRLEIEELVPYFLLRSERTYDEFASHKRKGLPEGSPAKSYEAYLTVLQRRWQHAVDLMQMVREAELKAQHSEKHVVGL